MNRFYAALCFLMLLLTAPQTGWAERFPLGSSLQDEARTRVREGDILPLGRVLADVRRRNPGTLLDAGLERSRGGPVYHIRWLTRDGRRIDYEVDARSGDILSAVGE